MPPANATLPPLASQQAAIYIRVSTPKQKEEGFSLETQLPACLAYAQQYGFPVRDERICIDDVTGKTLNRLGMNDLRDIVAQGLVQVVIVYKIDRFLRDFTYQLMMIQEFAQYGVQVLDTTSTPAAPSPERTLNQQILGVIAEFEHSQILERTERGRRGKAQAGIPFPRSPLGHRYVGKGKDGHYEIDREEAALVLQIFHWYARDGLTLHQIAARLNREQVPTTQMRRGTRRRATTTVYWRPATVYHILTNEAYLGTLHYGKTTNLASLTKPNKKTRHQATDPKTWTPIMIQALVPTDLFDAAQQRLKTNALQSRRRRKRDYLLIGGRLRCEVCGHHMSGMCGRERRYYRCLQRYNGEQYRACRRIRAERVESQVWEGVCHLVRHPEALAELMDMYRQSAGPAQIAQDRATLQEDLHKTQRALERLVDLYLTEDEDEPMPKALYQTQLTALKAQEQALAEHESQRAEMAVVLKAVNEVLDEATTIPAQQKILDMLSLTVFYTPQQDVRLQVVLKQRRPLAVRDGVSGFNTAA